MSGGEPAPIDPWRLRAEREQRARREAEALLEGRSRELMRANERLEQLAEELREQVALSSEEVVQAHFALDRLSDAVFVLNEEGRILRINRTLLLETGWSRDRLTELRLTDLDELCTEEAWRQHWSAAINQEGVTFEGRFRRRGSDGYPVEVRLSHLVHQGGDYVLAVARDISERQRQQRDLERAREEAEQANLAKSRFLANMSHEIRTPLAAITGMVELLGDASPSSGPGLRTQQVQRVQRHAAHLTALIDSVLDLSRIEAGRLEVAAEDVDLHQLFSDLGELFAGEARAKGLELGWNLAGDVPRQFKTDGLRLRQVLSNLVSNAIKYTPRGRVDVELAMEDECLLAVVSDTGPGIPTERLGVIFEAFQQANNVAGTGTGLGLSIARSLCEALGGELDVESEAGKGARFWFRIPEVDLDDSDPVHNPRIVLDDWVGALAGHRILVADDSEDLLALARYWLEGAGAEVLTAVDGADAVRTCQLAVAEGRAPQALILDMQMPHLGGEDALAAMRAAGHEMPAIAMTAHALVQDRERCLRLGFAAHLGKPVRPGLLVGTLAHLLGVEVGEQERRESPSEGEAPVDAPASRSARGGHQPEDDRPIRSSRAGDERFRPLLETYLAGLPEQVEALEAAFDSKRAGDLRTLVHRLRGSGGGYGFQEITEVCSRCEEALITAGASGVDDDVVSSTYIELRSVLARVTL